MRNSVLKYIKKNKLFLTKKGENLKIEKSFILLLNAKNEVVKCKMLGKGGEFSVKYSQMDLEDFIFEPFEKKIMNDYKIVKIHNHPGGCLSSSVGDDENAKKSLKKIEMIIDLYFKKYGKMKAEIFFAIFAENKLNFYNSKKIFTTEKKLLKLAKIARKRDIKLEKKLKDKSPLKKEYNIGGNEMLNYKKKFSVEKYEALLDDSRADFFALNSDVKHYLVAEKLNVKKGGSYIDGVKSLPTNFQLKKILKEFVMNEIISFSKSKNFKNATPIIEIDEIKHLFNDQFYFRIGHENAKFYQKKS